MEIYAHRISSKAKDLLNSHSVCNVHSRYNNTINLIFGDRYFVSLTTAQCALHPFSICLPLITLNALRISGECFIEDGWINSSGRDRIYFQNTDTENLTMSNPGEKPALKPPTDRLIRCCTEAANRSALGFLIVPEYLSPLKIWQDKIMAFMSAAAAGDTLGTVKTAHKLLGMGWGLTPSFDDFCVGFLAALWFSSRLSERSISEIGKRLAEEAYKQTTLISYNFIYYAGMNYFSESILKLLNCMKEGNNDKLPEAVNSLIAMGHSSGADTLVGIVKGLQKV